MINRELISDLHGFRRTEAGYFAGGVDRNGQQTNAIARLNVKTCFTDVDGGTPYVAKALQEPTASNSIQGKGRWT